MSNGSSFSAVEVVSGNVIETEKDLIFGLETLDESRIGEYALHLKAWAAHRTETMRGNFVAVLWRGDLNE